MGTLTYQRVRYWTAALMTVTVYAGFGLLIGALNHVPQPLSVAATTVPAVVYVLVRAWRRGTTI